MNRFACLIAPILLSAASSAFAAVQYTVVDLGTLGGQYSYAIAINAAGQIVGNSDAGPNVGEHAFLYSNGVMKDLGTLGGISEAWAIDSSGVVVGDSAVSPSGDIHAFFTRGSNMSDITAADSRGYARGINSHGEIVGEGALNTGLYDKPFFYSNATLTYFEPLGQTYGAANAINDAGQIVGYTGIAGGERAFLYQNGVSTDLGTLGGTWARTVAYAINQAGAVVGWAMNEQFQHAFLYENGQMQDLGALPPDGHNTNYSEAFAINDRGVIVGDSNLHAVRWVNGTISDLNQMIPPDFAIYLTEATGINDSGEIICNGFVNGHAHAFLLVPGVTPPALGVQGSLHRVNTRRHAMIQGITTNGPVKNVTFHVGRVMPGHGTASHSGGTKVEHPRYANGTSSWSLATALKPGRNYVTITAHGSYGDSRPITVEIIQK